MKDCWEAGRRRSISSPAFHIARLPDSVTFNQYIGGGCGLLTAVHIVERAAIRRGDSVLVQGTGAVGLSTIALARSSGADHVFAIGAPVNRLDLARRMGADWVFDLTTTSPEERLEHVRNLTHGEGVDIVVEAAGSARAFEEGPYLARDGGRYIVAGHYTDAGLSSVNAHTAINRKHLEIRGCWGSEPAHFLRALTVSNDLRPPFRFDAIGEQTYRLDQLNQALADAESMRNDESACRSMGHRLEARMRHTKIVATVGPASNSPKMIEALLLAGVDLFRLNFSHGTHQSHRAAFQTIRDASAQTGRVAAVMQDVSGPKIRTGSLAGGTPLTLPRRRGADYCWGRLPSAAPAAFPRPSSSS